jgi:hypothetical protein
MEGALLNEISPSAYLHSYKGDFEHTLGLKCKVCLLFK